jgi:glycosyltransferase involved in cell wall biosynthesis
MGRTELFLVSGHLGLEGLETLVIVSHVRHYQYEAGLYAYGPYSREIDVWADLFPSVVIAAPCRKERPPGDCVKFTRSNITVRPQIEVGGRTLAAKVKSVANVPALAWGLVCAMRCADAVHVRCPGNLGLLGTILAPLFSKCLIAKYAGQWNGYPGEPWTFRLQRRLLRSGWWSGPVTIYGQWPWQPPKVVSFFTSVLTEDQLRRAARAAKSRRVADKLRVLFVGRVSAPKNVHVLLEALALLKSEGIPVQCFVVGEGPERSQLQLRSEKLGLAECVDFTGGTDLDAVLAYYERSDVLVLASESEGWPKAVAEAMAFGLVCVGSNRGLVPEMLADGRGLVVEPGDAAELADILKRIATLPGEYEVMRARAAAWGQNYSLEALREALEQLFATHWRPAPPTQLCRPT